LIVASAVAIALSLGSFFADSSLKVGLYESARPLTYVESKKPPAGFEADFAGLLAEKLGRKAKLVLLDTPDIAEAMADGTVDCFVSVRESVQSAMDGYPETEAFISYGTVVILPPEAVVSGVIVDDALLRGKKIGVQVNTDAEVVCEELLKSIAFNVRKYDIEQQPFQDLKLSRNDAVIADELYARFMQKEDPESFRIAGAAYIKRQFGLRLSSKISNEYAGQIEGALHELKSDIALRDLFLKWFGADLSAP
jgi:ABC-type amino acid transport substrate-binding protein